MGEIKSVFDYTWDGEEGVGGGCAAFIKSNRPSRGVYVQKEEDSSGNVVSSPL